MTKNEILIYGESIKNKKIASVVFELISQGIQLKEKLPDSKLTVALLGNFFNNLDELSQTFGAIGVDCVLIVDNEKLTQYSNELYSKCLIDIIKHRTPAIFLLGATTQGRDLAPLISTQLKTGLTADCTQLDINEKGQLAATRPTFGGNLMATILSKKYPQMATVRPNVFKKQVPFCDKKAEIIKYDIDLSKVVVNIEILSKQELFLSDFNDLLQAQIVVVGGRGLKSKENFEKLYTLARFLNASVGATRAAVEAGMAPKEIQIGQTGKTVSPQIYIAFGVSGAIQHVVGMNSSNVVISINNDKNAPLNKIANYTIVGDALDIIPKWISKLEQVNS